MKEWLIVVSCVLFSLFIVSVQASNTVNFPFTNVTYYGVDQTGANSIFGRATDVMFTPDGSSLLAVDYYNNKIYKFYEANLLNYSTFDTPRNPLSISFAAPNTYLVATFFGLFKTSDLVTFTQLTDGNPYTQGVTYDQGSGLVYVSTGNNQVTAYSLEPFAVVRVYGSFSQGTSSSQFNVPNLMAVDKQGGLWVADYYNNRVLHFGAGSTTADIVLGQPDFTSKRQATSPSDLNSLFYPVGVALDDSNDNLYVTDSYLRVVRYRGPFTSGQGASGVLDAQADFACSFLTGIRARNNADGSVQVVFADSQKIVSGVMAAATPTSTASLSATSEPSFTSTAAPSTTVSLSGTSTASVSSTSTASVSSTSTASLSSSSPSLTNSLSRTRSVTRTLSNSRSLSRSTSGSRSVSKTPSNSRSHSRSGSRTRSASPPPGGRVRSFEN